MDVRKQVRVFVRFFFTPHANRTGTPQCRYGTHQAKVGKVGPTAFFHIIEVEKDGQDTNSWKSFSMVQNVIVMRMVELPLFIYAVVVDEEGGERQTEREDEWVGGWVGGSWDTNTQLSMNHAMMRTSYSFTERKRRALFP